MSAYDVILLHPPAVMDFRRRPIFTGALGSSVEQVQFNKVPIGSLSIADYLDRHGCRVKIDNICDRMVTSLSFDPEEHLRGLSAKVFAVGLHFQQHGHGALEVARLCKKLHPDSLVIMGGLTATRFHDEIMRDYDFVDGVIRGEAEKPFLKLMQGLDRNGSITATPSLTWRTAAGTVVANPLQPASRDLDEFEFTRFDLIEPKTSIFPVNAPARWSLTVCRGCLYNCTICGGSAYSYKKYLGMDRPAFRSPARIIADVKKLNEQGVYTFGIYQDARMGGRDYWQELFAGLAGDDLRIDSISLDLLVTADEEFIRAASQIGKQVVMHICPDSGCNSVRRKLGRNYTSEELLNTVALCHRYGMPVTTFFSVGMADENEEGVRETWALWAQLSAMDKAAHAAGKFPEPFGGPIVGPILIDPGSLAFDNPEEHGYTLRYKNLQEYVAAMVQPSWHQWLNYETEQFDNGALVAQILATMQFAVEQRYGTGFYDDATAIAESARTALDREVVREVNQIMTVADLQQRATMLAALKKKLDTFLNKPIESFVK